FALIACGGGGTSTPPQTTKTTTLTVCQAGISIAFFSEYVAQQQGYFKAQGLNVPTPIQVTTGAKAAAGIEAGSCQIANGVITDAFGLQKIDSSVRVIGALLNAYAVDIIVSKKFSQEMKLTASSTLAEKVNALKGKKIGITGPGTGTQALLTYLFKLEGMNAAKDATQVSLGSNSTAAMTALQSGTVDALSYFVPLGQAAEARGAGEILISPVRGDIPELVGDIQGVFYTKQSVITAQPQAVSGYIRAIGQAEAFIHSNPAQAKTLLAKYLNLNANVVEAIYTANASAVANDPQISQAGYNIAGQFHLQTGLITAVPPFDQLIATSTINGALAKS
ncbi:MAG TPA: ABC transporter substrate-binding protein, partial [Ktedonobacteraceae bacterium]|nr:ABC transporter substrate-binding protein [Ktedonobacteraceae bacterium]